MCTIQPAIQSQPVSHAGMELLLGSRYVPTLTRLKPLRKATPLDQPGMAMKLSGRTPSSPRRLPSTWKDPLHHRNRFSKLAHNSLSPAYSPYRDTTVSRVSPMSLCANADATCCFKGRSLQAAIRHGLQASCLPDHVTAHNGLARADAPLVDPWPWPTSCLPESLIFSQAATCPAYLSAFVLS